MKVQVQRWGNSLALRIPKSFAVESNIEQGSVVEVSLDQGRIVVEPVRETDYTLEELLSGVTKRNLHAEVDGGAAVGKEVW
ncbi:MAG TPA: AbrB/MazE/SpoVT family DNA-binding domain-containing protein [Pyrinomonadaceae bacterium]|jgi:antitoxin MazE|nr:AbrB/MazE/SpoVT family DNA-binding domain-containing protein [Pyrinomonadaceae bacterium]